MKNQNNCLDVVLGICKRCSAPREIGALTSASKPPQSKNETNNKQQVTREKLGPEAPRVAAVKKLNLVHRGNVEDFS